MKKMKENMDFRQLPLSYINSNNNNKRILKIFNKFYQGKYKIKYTKAIDFHPASVF